MSNIKLHSLGDGLLFQGSGPSTIDANGLNFRVRDGNGCTPIALPPRQRNLISGSVVKYSF